MPSIHSTAIVADGAVIAEDAVIGPYCVIGANVELAAGVELVSHVCVDGHTTLGEGTRVFPFASIGHAPQDLKYKGEPTTLIIGRGNVIREHVTMNPGTESGGGKTVVGDNGLFMVGSHVAHDCHVGDNVILANNATLGGHVQVGDFAILGGLCAVHQFSRIGKQSMIGGMSGVEGDVIPFGSVIGNRARLQGLNVVGLKRRNFDREQIHGLRAAYRQLFSQEGTMAERVAEVEKTYGASPGVRDILDFLKAQSNRPLCLPSIAEHGG